MFANRLLSLVFFSFHYLKNATTKKTPGKQENGIIERKSTIIQFRRDVPLLDLLRLSSNVAQEGHMVALQKITFCGGSFLANLGIRKGEVSNSGLLILFAVYVLCIICLVC